MKKAVLLASVLVLLSTAVIVRFVRPGEAGGTIYIRADGSVEPDTAPISSGDNVTYTFNDNIYEEIVVERDNIVVDGNGHTVQGPGGLSFLKGISLSGRINVTIENMEIRAFYQGIWLNMSSNNNLNGNNIADNISGVSLDSSDNNTVTKNRIRSKSMGIYLYNSSNNVIVGNNITDGNSFGISLLSSSNNLLRNNSMSDNQYNFQVSMHANDIDTSNTVNGKPVYYWVGKRDMTVPRDTGYIALINCTHITVKNLSLTNNGQGLFLANTNNSKIVNNNVTDNFYGIQLIRSYKNTISRNNITNNGVGVSLSSNNIISENNITNNEHGIILDMNSNNIIISKNNIANRQIGIQISISSNNTIYGNSIIDNKWGIQLNSGELFGYSSNNSIHHNNFIGNTQQVWVVEVGDIPPSAYTNFWDDGYPSGGNYWSNYTGVDSNYDGIGDTKHVLNANNKDNYPLMGPFHSFNTTLGLPVNVISNSTIESFQYFESNSTIKMYVSNMTLSQTFGFCRVCIPNGLMSFPYTVIIDDGLTEVLYFNDKIYDNSTHRWIYFAYEHSTHEIDLIPEFPTWIPMLLVLVVLTVAVFIHKQRLLKICVRARNYQNQ